VVFGFIRCDPVQAEARRTEGRKERKEGGNRKWLESVIVEEKITNLMN
jgi:hypothetical protein